MSDPNPAQVFVDEQLRKRSGAYRRLMDALGDPPNRMPAAPKREKVKQPPPKPVNPDDPGLFRW